MSDDSKPKLDPRAEDRTDSQRLGDEISSAIIQTGACWATDVIDPIVSKKLQDRFGTGATHAQVWGGEIIGDSVGGFIYIVLKQLSRGLSKIPGIGDPIENAILGLKNKFDTRLTRSGEKALAHWAKEHHVDKDDPRYQRKLDNYKYFQAESTVDSWIVAGASAGANIIAQKHVFKNTNPWQVIAGSKLVGSVATLTLMHGANKSFPNFMQTMDHELSDRYFSKVADKVKSTFGLQRSEAAEGVVQVEERKKSGDTPLPVLETLTAGTLTAMALKKVHNREEELVQMLPKSLGIGAGVVGGMFLAHAIIPDSVNAFNRELHNRYLPKWKRQLGFGEDKDRDEKHGHDEVGKHHDKRDKHESRKHHDKKRSSPDDVAPALAEGEKGEKAAKHSENLRQQEKLSWQEWVSDDAPAQPSVRL